MLAEHIVAQERLLLYEIAHRLEEHLGIAFTNLRDEPGVVDDSMPEEYHSWNVRQGDDGRAITCCRQSEPCNFHVNLRPQDELIDYMVRRFLNWRLPENFYPDGGISFAPKGNEGTPHEYKRQPIGTNLLTHEQATEMVRYMLEGFRSASPQADGDPGDGRDFGDESDAR